MVQYNIGIALMTSSKNNNLAYFRQLLKKLLSKRTYVDACIYFFACWKLYLQSDIMWLAEILVTVYEGLV